MNLTDNEIIKALECCADGTFRCGECCYEPLKFNECTPRILNDALDLINRQKAEIERLRESKAQLELKTSEEVHSLCAEIRTLQNSLNAHKEEIYRLENNIKNANAVAAIFTLPYRETRAEAIKEFAERLKAETKGLLGANFVDDLVKEMVGE